MNHTSQVWGWAGVGAVDGGGTAIASPWQYLAKHTSQHRVATARFITGKELKDPENKTIIIPDEKLNELLEVDSDEILTFFTKKIKSTFCFL